MTGNISATEVESSGLLSVTMIRSWLVDFGFKYRRSMDKILVLLVGVFLTNFCIAILNELTFVVDNSWYFNPRQNQKL